ncbi:MAG: type II toxin-antitoxin system VapB family antitoxin [Planctomycetes bacterium]|nr:type II toxin-antitoxin system VapB family antitoxin [Planctomycetota bacterium]
MATNLALDDELIEQAVKAGGHKSKKAAVTEALIQYIRKIKLAEFTELFGTFDWDESYDYKEARKS